MRAQSQGLVLLFGLTAAQEKKVRTAAQKWGIKCRRVPATAYNRNLLQLTAGQDTAEAAPADYDGPVPETRAILMAGLPGQVMQPFLAQLRRAGLPTSVLKAVLTEQNSRWTALSLLGELQREHEALSGGGGPAHSAAP